MNEKTLATCPDIITVMDSQSGRAITSESLVYGLRVAVICMESNSIWKTKRGLELVGPRYFGYEEDYLEF